ncbi:MAG: hypothetical protein Q4E42_03705 [Phascolarctobacterium sp.]|nr:hypothetical protein [Phascolarctobacterium sp.]
MGIPELKLLYDGIKGAANIVRTVDTAEAKLELYGTLLDLSGKALELQGKMQEMMDENKELRNKIEELQKVKITEEDIEYHEDAFVTLKNDPLKRKFCQKCWEKERKTYQIQPRYGFGKHIDYYICVNCDVHISDRQEFNNQVDVFKNMNCNTKYDPLKDM